MLTPVTTIIAIMQFFVSLTRSDDELLRALKSVAGVYKSQPVGWKYNINQTVLATAGNFGYLNHLQNFYCFAERLNFKFVVFSFDKKVHDHLQSKSDMVSVLWSARNIPSGNTFWKQAGFNAITSQKKRAAVAVMELGYDLIFSDSDNIILKDPLPYLMKIPTVVDYVHAVNAPCPQNRGTFDLSTMEGNTGFYFARARPTTIQIWRDTVKVCEGQKELDDQTIFWRVLRKYTDPHIVALPSCSDTTVRTHLQHRGGVATNSSSSSRSSSSSGGSSSSSISAPAVGGGARAASSFVMCALDNCAYSCGMLRAEPFDKTIDSHPPMQVLKHALRSTGDTAMALHANFLKGNKEKRERLEHYGLWLVARDGGRRRRRQLAANTTTSTTSTTTAMAMEESTAVVRGNNNSNRSNNNSSSSSSSSSSHYNDISGGDKSTDTHTMIVGSAYAQTHVVHTQTDSSIDDNTRGSSSRSLLTSNSGNNNINDRTSHLRHSMQQQQQHQHINNNNNPAAAVAAAAAKSRQPPLSHQQQQQQRSRNIGIGVTNRQQQPRMQGGERGGGEQREEQRGSHDIDMGERGRDRAVTDNNSKANSVAAVTAAAGSVRTNNNSSSTTNIFPSSPAVTAAGSTPAHQPRERAGQSYSTRAEATKHEGTSTRVETGAPSSPIILRPNNIIHPSHPNVTIRDEDEQLVELDSSYVRLEARMKQIQTQQAVANSEQQQGKIKEEMEANRKQYDKRYGHLFRSRVVFSNSSSATAITNGSENNAVTTAHPPAATATDVAANISSEVKAAAAGVAERNPMANCRALTADL